MCVCSFAQEKSWEVGLRDNQFAHFNFLGESGWLWGYEQSLMNVKPKEQTGRFFVGQTKEFKYFGYSYAAYAGMNYHRSFGMFGARLTAMGRWKRISGSFTFNPNYDSGYKFQGNCQIDGALQLLKDQGVSFTAAYGNLPEYRNNIEYMRLGLKFASTDGKLWVKPEVCMPNVGNGSENLRVLVSMGWRISIDDITRIR